MKRGSFVLNQKIGQRSPYNLHSHFYLTSTLKRCEEETIIRDIRHNNQPTSFDK